MVTVAWLSLGIASVALALIAALVLRSERESTAILHHLNVISLNLQDVLSDLADAEAEARGYVLTGRGAASKISNGRTRLWLWSSVGSPR
jgi:CHASE3 domain sensor protein